MHDKAIISIGVKVFDLVMLCTDIVCNFKVALFFSFWSVIRHSTLVSAAPEYGLNGKIGDSLSHGEAEHAQILQEMVDHMEEDPQNSDVDIHILKEEVLRPELDETGSKESEINGIIRAFRKTVAFQQAYNALDDNNDANLKSDIRKIIGEEIPSKSHNGESNAHTFGRRLERTKIHRRDEQIAADPTALCEDSECSETVEVNNTTKEI